MILNERLEDLFSKIELCNVEREKTVQDKYNNLTDTLQNPFDPNHSEILDFSIKDNDGKDSAKLSGILDYADSQFLVRKIDIQEDVYDTNEVLKRLINSVIVNLETQHPEISLIYWRINIVNKNAIKAAADMGFEVQDSNTYSFEMVYYLASSPVRKNYNSLQVGRMTKISIDCCNTLD